MNIKKPSIWIRIAVALAGILLFGFFLFNLNLWYVLLMTIGGAATESVLYLYEAWINPGK